MNIFDRLDTIENGWKPKEKNIEVFKNTLRDGTIEYRNAKAEYHNNADLPSYISAAGEKRWYKNGLRHRDNDLPAEIWPDGSQVWYQNGKKHRDNDKPAFINNNDGSQIWYKDGKYHRDNDKPAIIYPNGLKYWYVNDELIRTENEI